MAGTSTNPESAETPTTNNGLVRSLRRWDLVGVVLNGVIGAGIFGLPSKVFGLDGGYSLLAFVMCALFVAAIVMCFAEVGSRYTGTGGPYLYASETYGSLTGYTVGWLIFISRVSSLAANASLLITYIGLFAPSTAAGALHNGSLTAVVILFTLVNVAGVGLVAGSSNLLAIGKLVPLVIFVAFGLFALNPAQFSGGTVPDYHSFSQSVLLLIYAFTGFEMAVIPAGEAKNPGRNLPIALLIGMAVVVVLYVGIQVVCIGTLPGLASSQRPLADAAAHFLGTWGAVMITAGVVVSIAGNLNVSLLSASRIIFAMGERGDLPGSLARVNPRYRTPVIAVILTGAIMLALTLSGKFIYLATMSTLARLVAFLVTCTALPVLRRRPSAPAAIFRMPGGVPIAILSVILGVWLLMNSTWIEARDTAIATAIGLVIYGLNRRFRSSRREIRPTSA